MSFVDFHLWQWCSVFAISAVAVFATSRWLVSATGTIGDYTGLSRGFLGAVMLATATSLPEIFTGVSAVTLTDSPDLAVGIVFGSNLFNLLIIGVMELTLLGPSLLSSLSKPTKLSMILSGLLILAAIVLLASLQSEIEYSPFTKSVATSILIVMYASFLWLLHRAEVSEHFSQPGELAAKVSDHSPQTDEPAKARAALARAIGIYSLSTLLIALASIGLSIAGENIGILTGLSASFVGSLLIALSTSLPEVATSFAALRIGSPDMAVSNMTGSNLFNTGIVLFTSDVAYQASQNKYLLSSVSRSHLITAAVSLTMTAIVAIGAYIGPSGRKRYGTLTVGSVALILLFLVAQYWLFADSFI